MVCEVEADDDQELIPSISRAERSTIFRAATSSFDLLHANSQVNQTPTIQCGVFRIPHHWQVDSQRDWGTSMLDVGKCLPQSLCQTLHNPTQAGCWKMEI
jgi:hypothetical protein